MNFTCEYVYKEKGLFMNGRQVATVEEIDGINCGYWYYVKPIHPVTGQYGKELRGDNLRDIVKRVENYFNKNFDLR